MLSILKEQKKSIMILFGGILLGVFLSLSVILGLSEKTGISGLETKGKKSLEEVQTLPGEVQSGYRGEDLATDSPRESQETATSKQSDRMLVINRNITLRVSSVRKAAEKIEKLTLKNDGYIVSMSFDINGGIPEPLSEKKTQSSESDINDVREGNITVRIPVARYKSFIQSAKKEGVLLNESENASDVTREYIDLAARLRNLQREEARLLQIFDSAKTVKDMILVENELRRIREEIESLTVQKKHLEESSSYAMISFTLQKTLPLVEPGKEGWGFDAAFKQAVKNFVAILKGAIVAIGTILPLALLAAAAYALFVLGKFTYKLMLQISGKNQTP